MKAKKVQRSKRVASDELLAAADPFRRFVALIEPLGVSDSKPLSAVLPGLWPTLGELRAFVKAANEKLTREPRMETMQNKHKRTE